MAPSLTINHLITKFHAFSLTLAPLQHSKLSATSPRHILGCALSHVTLSGFSSSISLPDLLVDVAFSTHSKRYSPYSPEFCSSPLHSEISTSSRRVLYQRSPNMTSSFAHSFPADLVLDVQLSGGPAALTEASNSTSQ